MAGKTGKRNTPLDRLVRGRARYVVNQKAPIHGDRRGKRNRDRSTHKRHAVEDQSD